MQVQDPVTLEWREGRALNPLYRKKGCEPPAVRIQSRIILKYIVVPYYIIF